MLFWSLLQTAFWWMQFSLLNIPIACVIFFLVIALRARIFYFIYQKICFVLLIRLGAKPFVVATCFVYFLCLYEIINGNMLHSFFCKLHIASKMCEKKNKTQIFFPAFPIAIDDCTVHIKFFFLTRQCWMGGRWCISFPYDCNILYAERNGGKLSI